MSLARKISRIPLPVLAGPGVVMLDANSRPDSRAAVNSNARGPSKVQLTLSEAIKGVGKAGELITLAVNPSDTSDQNAEIDSYLGGYSPFGFVADLVCPVVLVDQEKALRRDFADSNAFEVVNTETGRKGAINEIDHHSGTTPYETTEHALAAFISFAAEDEAVSNYNVKAASAKLISDKMQLAREVRVINMLTTLTNWDANNRTTLGGTLKWDNGSAKNPRADIQARIETSASQITGMLLNPTVLFWLLSDAEVRDSMRQSYGDASPGEIYQHATQQVETLSIAGLPPITVAPAQRNAVGGGREYILGDDVVLCSQPQGVPIDGSTISTCHTFRTKGRSGTG